MITSFYGADVSEAPRDAVWRERYERLFEEGELFLAEGRAMEQALLALGCPARKIRVQHLGVDLDALPFSLRCPDSTGVVRILISATFREKKGIPDALKAISLASRRCKNLSVTLMGDAGSKPKDAEQKDTILRWLEELDGIVHWVGFQPYPVFRDALQAHHLFLSPSRTAATGDTEGGAPVSIIEAQATGMPVISTFHADIPEVVDHEHSGLLSPEGDPERLAANVERLARQPRLWAQMGRVARDRMAEHYNVRTQVVRLEEIYAELAGHRDAPALGPPVCG
jgi:colanic acid/amylovoran biosynthesis glycosyltransferase